MLKINYEPYIIESMLDALRKVFKENVGFKLNTVEVERYVSSMRTYLEENGIHSDWEKKSNELIEKYLIDKNGR